MSPIIPAPNIEDIKSWSAKNTGLLAATYMLAATSFGLSTAPMEGYDESRVCFQLGIPRDRYFVPMIVATGYAKKQKPTSTVKHTESESESESQEEEEGDMGKIRFRRDEVVYGEKFGVSL